MISYRSRSVESPMPFLSSEKKAGSLYKVETAAFLQECRKTLKSIKDKILQSLEWMCVQTGSRIHLADVSHISNQKQNPLKHNNKFKNQFLILFVSYLNQFLLFLNCVVKHLYIDVRDSCSVFLRKWIHIIDKYYEA